MERILERYERYSLSERQLLSTDPDPQLPKKKNGYHQLGNPFSFLDPAQGNWSMDYPKLTARIEVLQRNLRHFVGEDLDPLSLRELQNLEQQLDTALKRIRTRKNQLMHESISELQKKEKSLVEQNNALAKKVKEKEKVEQNNRAQWEQQNNIGQNSSAYVVPPPPLQLPSLTMGGSFVGRAVEEDGAEARPSPNTLMPPWMLRHVNE
ncbi:Agamous-like MADS-box protein AGL8-like [Vitis vinifera]|uniref:Agamous-like MADS-box protein AGL8-like n=1 Tax=Vitis vinifera TaxID=29760 RepID=A0A438IMV6_VITVI|nr:Agamous-like MADS-box protein AGL8-like [Vitis vinifera]RVW98052.1 Agamous-like MADS-box protein AGL8-like [Vitis vinifera]